MLLLAIALQAAPAAPSPGQRPQPPATILLEPAAAFLAACDANADARTTRAERDACVSRAYATAGGATSGGVGYIAYGDWALRWLGNANALPSPYEVDADGDNRIALPELQRRFAALFDRYDVDRDGALARAELVTLRARPPGDEEERRRRRARGRPG